MIMIKNIIKSLLIGLLLVVGYTYADNVFGVSMIQGSSAGYQATNAAKKMFMGGWQRIGGGFMPDGGAVSSIALDGAENIYASTYKGNVYKAAISGGTWQLVGGGTVSIITPEVTPIALDKVGNIYAGGGMLVYKAAINGGTWEPLGGVQNPLFGYDASIVLDTVGNIYTVSNQNTGFTQWYPLYVGAIYPNCFRDNICWAVAGGGGLPYLEVAISIALDNVGNIYVSGYGPTRSDVFIAAIKNGTWKALGGGGIPQGGCGVTSGEVNTMALNNKGNIYVGSSGNCVYQSAINNGHWVQLGSGMPDGSVALTIGLDVEGHTIYAGGMTGSSVYKAAINNPVWNQLGGGKISGAAGIDAIVLDKVGNVYVGTGSVNPNTVGGVYKCLTNGN